MTAEVNEEEEQKTLNIAGNKTEASSADYDNFRDIEFTLSYDKIKEIAPKNPNITVKEFYKKLKKR
ncbi:hypothetical protein [Wolbachia endosymbiont of Mansonella perstans]|uniref:hypothetical protein n=1 Tax=Wolbachia endosymbiont of Mansonella perstans TaxID=229526 RepID=UPI001CE07C50|nr:hypothetical protein [Wolbachia endosymbiont of Mansonella perstans]